MDKYEYNLKLDQIKSLVAEKDYSSAAQIADTINWRKIKNVNALVKAGEVYEEVGRYEDSKEILLMAYDRSPIGRMIIYRLAEVAMKMGNFDEAKDYYNEFIEIAPHDNLKYVLRYHISKAQEEDIRTRIGILEELKEQEYSEEWAYELAYLYHEAGMSEKCIEACDELILWFGDGAYVEKALELKMLYQPLSKQQEKKYRQLQEQKEGVIEVRPEDQLESGEIVHEAVKVPDLEISKERFNTQNLQEELQKNIRQIMEATKRETVDDSIDTIKKLVEDFPYLKIPPEGEEDSDDFKEEEPEEASEETEQLRQPDFREMLNEEQDGQMSLMVSDHDLVERQITGQLSLEDILADWEKTSQAVRTAPKEEDQRKLESVKARALQEAGDIMDRLADVIPKLDSGLTPRELLEEQYRAGKPIEDDKAAEMVASMNQLLQQEIDRLSNENAQIDEQLAAAMNLSEASVEKDQDLSTGEAVQASDESKELGSVDGMIEIELPEIDMSDLDFSEEQEAEYPKILKETPVEIQAEPEGQMEVLQWEEELPQVPEAPEEIVSDPEGTEQTIKETEQPDSEALEENPDTEKDFLAQIDKALQNEINDKEQSEVKQPTFQWTREEIDSISDKLLQKGPEQLPADEAPKKSEQSAVITKLSKEQRAIFTYFVPIKGMENQLCQAMSGVIEHLNRDETASTGNLIIQGGQGSGKTVLATSMVKALCQQTGKLTGRIGKIEASVLNKKDLAAVLEKAAGGCIIIEKAGDISKETAIKLSLLLQSDTSGILVMIEDTRRGVEKALAKDAGFASIFTEKISIPIFTSDELVTFAKSYANELGYTIEEMGILALYNCISNIQKVDRATTLTEVKEIVDQAIRHVEKGGLKKMFSIITSRRFDQKDYVILREKDFNI